VRGDLGFYICSGVWEVALDFVLMCGFTAERMYDIDGCDRWAPRYYDTPNASSYKSVYFILRILFEWQMKVITNDQW